MCKELEEEQTEKASDEDIVFYLDQPILFDQNGAVLKADYKIAAGNGMSEITIMMDQAWLMDEERAYPITVDPTVRIEKNRPPLMTHLCVPRILTAAMAITLVSLRSEETGRIRFVVPFKV